MIEALTPSPPDKGMGNPYRTRGEEGTWSLSLRASRFRGALEVWKLPPPPVDVDVGRFGGSLEVWKPPLPPPVDVDVRRFGGTLEVWKPPTPLVDVDVDVECQGHTLHDTERQFVK